MENSLNQDRPRRREYSKQFKAEVLDRCAQPGTSVGGVALAHGLHSNMVHRWIREQRERQAAVPSAFMPCPIHFSSVPCVAGRAGRRVILARGSSVQIQRGKLQGRVKFPLP